MSNTQQQIVGAVGATMIALDYWKYQKPTVAAGAFNSKATPEQTAAAHKELIHVALEVSFVAVTALVAGSSTKAASGALAMMAALSLVWYFHWTNPQSTTATTKPRAVARGPVPPSHGPGTGH